MPKIYTKTQTKTRPNPDRTAKIKTMCATEEADIETTTTEVSFF